jgi:NAD(P)-dependent dehydrogenase (short-subunit alcohol dehydrogenase family)
MSDSPSAPNAALIQGASRGIGLELTRQLLEREPKRTVFATARWPEGSTGLTDLREQHEGRLVTLKLDVRDERSIEEATTEVREQAPGLGLLFNVAGVLHEGETQPEKRFDDVTSEGLQRAFEVNAFGPLLVAKHFAPLLMHRERAVIANMSARVGSIEDNRKGGWYAYRASKAAQNMCTKTLSIELRRRAEQLIVVALHPGTVDTDLSKPFQKFVPEGQLFDRPRAARQLLDLIDGFTPEQSGSFFAWDGKRIPW